MPKIARLGSARITLLTGESACTRNIFRVRKTIGHSGKYRLLTWFCTRLQQTVFKMRIFISGCIVGMLVVGVLGVRVAMESASVADAVKQDTSLQVANQSRAEGDVDSRKISEYGDTEVFESDKPTRPLNVESVAPYSKGGFNAQQENLASNTVDQSTGSLRPAADQSSSGNGSANDLVPIHEPYFSILGRAETPLVVKVGDTMQLVAAAHRGLEAENRDPNWAPTMEEHYRAYLLSHSEFLKVFSIERVACRTTLCEFQILSDKAFYFDDPEQLKGIWSDIRRQMYSQVWWQGMAPVAQGVLTQWVYEYGSLRFRALGIDQFQKHYH